VPTVRPASDVALGGWTNESGGTSLFASLNEASRSDVSLVRSLDNPNADTFEVALGSIGAGALADGTLNIVVGKGINNAIVIDQTVRLMQGATPIATWSYLDVPYGPTLKTEALTGPQLASITNYADLRIRVTATVPSGLADFVIMRDGSQVTDRAGNLVVLR
jgi:hypothetical protein